MLRIAILALALIAGGGAAWLAYSLLGESGEPTVAEIPQSVPTKEVMVADAPIQRGDELGPANLAWQAWPETALGPGMIAREDQPDALESHSGWISRTPILAGEPIRLERLAEGDGGLMALMVTPGMRAAAVAISAESGAGGFILPNDRIDILHTVIRDVDGDGENEPVTTTIIRNVRVLAVDQVAEEGEAGNAKVAETVTLELTPEQVELLTMARNSGGLSMALRSIADFGETEVGDIAYLTPGSAHRTDTPPPPTGEQAGMARTEVESSDLEEPAAPAQSGEPEPPAIRRRGPLEVRIIGSGQVETVRIGGEDE